MLSFKFLSMSLIKIMYAATLDHKVLGKTHSRSRVCRLAPLGASLLVNPMFKSRFQEIVFINSNSASCCLVMNFFSVVKPGIPALPGWRSLKLTQAAAGVELCVSPYGKRTGNWMHAYL